MIWKFIVEFKEGTTIIVGDELKTCGMDNKINQSDKIVCFPEKFSSKVQTIKMPDSARIIGPKAFKHFKNLTEVHFSSNLEEICMSAFLGCSLLKTVYLPKSLKIIESRAFNGFKIENLYFDDSIFVLDKIETSGAFSSISKVHCSDCIVDFTQKQFYISELNYKGSKEDWEKSMDSHWLNERSAKIICSDGIIEHLK